MKKYVKQYRTETTRDEKNRKVNRVVYTGAYYEIKKEKTKRTIFLVSACIFFALHFAVGFLNTQSSRVFYVTLPYAVLFFPGVYYLMGAFTFCRSKGKMELPTYEKSVVRMRRSLTGLFWGLGYLLCAEILFMILSVNRDGGKQEELFREGVFLIICAINFVQIFRNKKNIGEMEVSTSSSPEA